MHKLRNLFPKTFEYQTIVKLLYTKLKTEMEKFYSGIAIDHQKLHRVPLCHKKEDLRCLAICL